MHDQIISVITLELLTVPEACYEVMHKFKVSFWKVPCLLGLSKH